MKFLNALSGVLLLAALVFLGSVSRLPIAVGTGTSTPLGCPFISNASCSIPVYPVGKPYAQNQIVQGSDGNIYRSVVSSNISDPASATECGTNWQPAAIYFSKTVNINAAGSAQCADIPTALTFMSKTSVAAAATVTYQLADGTYSLTSAIMNLNHPFGPHFSIIGNAATPANVILNYPGPAGPTAGLFRLDSGHSFGTINGLTANGPGSSDVRFPFSNFVIVLGPGFITVGPNLVTNNAYSLVSVFDGGVAYASSTTCVGGGDGCYWAYGAGSLVKALNVDCSANHAGTISGVTWSGSCFLVDNGGQIYADGACAYTNDRGISYFSGGIMRVDGTTKLGKDCSSVTHTNSVADMFFTNTSAYNLQGTPVMASTTQMLFSWTSADGILTANQSDIGAISSNGPYAQQVYRQGTVTGQGGFVGVNQAGQRPFENDTDTAQVLFFKTFSNATMPLQFGCCGNKSLVINGDHSITAYFPFNVKGSTSGLVSIKSQAAAGTYNFNLPITAGSAGQVLTSQAGGSTAMTWSSVIPLSGTTSAIGGSPLLAGACAEGTVTVTGATSSMVATASPSSDPDSVLSTGIAVYSFVSAADTVKVRVCAIVAVTPASVTYNVRVAQ